MDTNYGMEIVRATEIAALTAARTQGLGDYIDILNTARSAIAKTLNRLKIDGSLINDRFESRDDIIDMPLDIGFAIKLAQLGHNGRILGKQLAQGALHGGGVFDLQPVDKLLAIVTETGIG